MSTPVATTVRGLRIVQVSAVVCALILAGAVVAAAAEVPQRLLIGLWQAGVILALVAPYVAILALVRKGSSPAQLGWGVLLARVTGWTALLFRVGILVLLWPNLSRTGPHPGEGKMVLTSVLLVPAALVLLLAGRRLAKEARSTPPPRPGGWVVAILLAAPIVGLPEILLFQFGWHRSWLPESTALGDVRTLISVQAAYSSTNEGLFGSAECLVGPKTCLPSYDGPTFLDPMFLRTTREGYVRVLHVGGAMPRGFKQFAYVAVPQEPGVTGVRGFCGDDTGAIYVLPEGIMPTIVDGRCPAGLSPVR